MSKLWYVPWKINLIKHSAICMRSINNRIDNRHRLLSAIIFRMGIGYFSKMKPILE